MSAETETPPALPKCHAPKAEHERSWSAIGYVFALLLLVALGGMGYFGYTYWQQQQILIGKLETRLGDLSAELEKQRAEVPRHSEAAGDLKLLQDRVAAMETELATAKAAAVATASSVAEVKLKQSAATAPDDLTLRMNYAVLQRAAASHDTFTGEASLFCMAARALPAFKTPCEEMAELAVRPTPTAADLYEQLAAISGKLRKSLRSPPSAHWLDRIAHSLDDLITIRKIDAPPAAAGPERTLFEATMAARRWRLAEAIKLTESLPEQVQQDLIPWQEAARARLSLDEKIQALHALLQPPPDQASKAQPKATKDSKP